MAVKVIHGHTCDDCEDDDHHDVPAQRHYVISIDGGLYKQLDFCVPCDRAVMSRILRLYEERGVELRPEPKEELAKNTVTTQHKPKELEQAPKQKPSTSKRKGLQIWCPLEHESEDGKGKFVSYKTRVPHARRHGLEIWEIEWKDVHGILQAACHAHAECVRTGLGFLNGQGVHTHISKVPLPRIDTEVPDE